MPNKDPEKRRAANQKHYQTHKPKKTPAQLARALELRRQRYSENPERAKEYMRAYNKLEPIRYMLSTARARAKKAGLEFTLTKEDFPNPPTHCPVLGIELEYGRGQGTRQDSSASLDRTDSALGYLPGNVKIVSWRANNLKGNATLAELEALVSYLRSF